ncbi:two-component response regulator for citrate [Klebsiella pneumoniae]|uniref:Two-component response regulator for citrate n=1 Tax=Klebsiella pneumoniae TaxID=573 RepID=A0A3S4GJD4_KLEPN|nr:two-component response regulator for citrate [Klebsiella pneumoniae]
MHHDLVDVLIIEDESELARLHAELVQKHPRLRLAGMAASLAQARQLLHATPPQLVLLDNYLPDGKGVTLMDRPGAGDQPMLGDLYHRRQRYGNLQPGHPQRRLRLYP